MPTGNLHVQKNKHHCAFSTTAITSSYKSSLPSSVLAAATSNYGLASSALPSASSVLAAATSNYGLASSAQPSAAPTAEIPVVAIVATLGVLVTVVLTVGGAIIGLVMWRRKQQPAESSDKQHLMQDEVDSSGFMIGGKQTNLFTAAAASKCSWRGLLLIIS